MVRNNNQTDCTTMRLHGQSNNNTASSLLEELRLQQQCFRDEGDRLAEDALQTRIEDAQEVLRQQETGVTATTAAAAASIPATSSRRYNPQAEPTDRFDDRGRAWCKFTDILPHFTMY